MSPHSSVTPVPYTFPWSVRAQPNPDDVWDSFDHCLNVINLWNMYIKNTSMMFTNSEGRFSFHLLFSEHMLQLFRHILPSASTMSSCVALLLCHTFTCTAAVTLGPTHPVEDMLVQSGVLFQTAAMLKWCALCGNTARFANQSEARCSKLVLWLKQKWLSELNLTC